MTEKDDRPWQIYLDYNQAPLTAGENEYHLPNESFFDINTFVARISDFS